MTRVRPEGCKCISGEASIEHAHSREGSHGNLACCVTLHSTEAGADASAVSRNQRGRVPNSG